MYVPTSAPYAIPVVVNAVRQLRPASILDVGVGFGKYGMLFREYTDIWHAETAMDRQRDSWRTRIEGIEIHQPYLTPVHEFVYDKIHVGHVADVLDGLGQYDLVFMGDVLEHFDSQEGHRLVEKLYEHASTCVLLTYPRDAKRREGFMGNPAEAHLSSWTRSDFAAYPGIAYATVEDRADIVALPKPPHAAPFLVGCFAARQRYGLSKRIGDALVRLVGPSNASSFVSFLLGRRVALRVE